LFNRNRRPIIVSRRRDGIAGPRDGEPGFRPPVAATI
jgi:hypothetical protein